MKKLPYLLLSFAALSLAACSNENSRAVKSDTEASHIISHDRVPANPAPAATTNSTAAQPGTFTMSVTGSETHINPNGEEITETYNGTMNDYDATHTQNGTLYDNNNGAGVVGTNTSYGRSVGTNGMQAPNITEENYQNAQNTGNRQ